MPNPKSSATATALLAVELAASAPEWVELLPAGPEIAARDGRRWSLADPQAVVAAFAENRGPLAIDYEHAQAHRAPKGEEAPAAGWITSVEVRSGAVWGRVEWTERAAAMIAAREYRFLSPEFTHSKAGEILALAGAGLVNRPALVMTALSREQEPPMSLHAIAAALSLATDADEPAVLARIRAGTEHRAALCQALDFDATEDEDADAAAILNAISGLKDKLATALAAAQDAVPSSELAAVSSDLAETKKALAALQEKDREREIDTALDEAAAAGKITPASRDQYRAMCATEGGLDRFRALAKTLPVICEPSGLDGRPARTSVADNTDPTALAREARKLVDERAAAGEALSVSEAVEIVQARA